MDNKVLDVRHLTVEFSNQKRTTVAVNNISFSLQKGQVLGPLREKLLGEKFAFVRQKVSQCKQ